MNEKRTADLYIRVSTDEQADKGYSQRNQEEMLRKYCLKHSIGVRNIIFEDHSAKSFNRPQWKKFLSDIKKRRKGPDLILFTKWDRFSRNAGDAYQMINILSNYAIEPQAIEQPLDLSIPENKMMLAFYLAAPEVENDRRALNVFYGMRRAKKEGRYMGLAPIGYLNKVDINGRKYIEHDKPNAILVKVAFEKLSHGTFNTEQVWKHIRNKGLKCSKNTFWQMIRNPVYCGKIFIPSFKDEAAYFVNGQHKAIISKELFDKVQMVLDSREKTYRTKLETNNDFPLKGFFICPKCGNSLTASKSKGRSKYYSYYHCFKGCSYRVNADKINDSFKAYLSNFFINEKVFPVFEKLLKEAFKQSTKELQVEKLQIEKQIEDYKKRIKNIKDFLATAKIDPEDYKEMKQEYEEVLNNLYLRKEKINNQFPPIEELLNMDKSKILSLNHIFVNKTIVEFRTILSQAFPEYLFFENEQVYNKRKSIILNYLYFTEI